MSLKLPYTCMSPGDEFNCLAIISFHVLPITLADGHHASGLSFTPDKFFYVETAQNTAEMRARVPHCAPGPSGSDWRRARRSWQRGASWRAAFPRVGGAREAGPNSLLSFAVVRMRARTRVLRARQLCQGSAAHLKKLRVRALPCARTRGARRPDPPRASHAGLRVFDGRGAASLARRTRRVPAARAHPWGGWGPR